MTEHDAAVSLVRKIGISEPQIAVMSDDETLFIEGVPAGDKHEWHCDRGACFFVAVLGLRIALENGKGKICVDRGPNHKHYFNTVEIMKAHERKNGFLPKRTMGNNRPMPAMYGTLAAKAVNGQFDTRRLIVPVRGKPVKAHGSAA